MFFMLRCEFGRGSKSYIPTITGIGRRRKQTGEFVGNGSSIVRRRMMVVVVVVVVVVGSLFMTLSQW